MYTHETFLTEDLTDWQRVCVGGVVRTVYSSQISRKDATCTSPALMEGGSKLTYRVGDNAMPGMWATVEGNIAIVSACLPTLRPVLRFVRGKRPSAATTTITQSQSNTGLSRSGYAQRRDFVKMPSDIHMESMSSRKRSETGSEELIAPSHVYDGKASTRGFVEEFRG